MNRAQWVRVARCTLLAVAFASVGCADDVVGRLEAPLTATSPTGQRYVLRGATFDVAGPVNQALITGAGGLGLVPTITSELPEGAYTIALRDGWSFARVEPDGSETAVAATVVDRGPIPFSIRARSTTAVRFRFRVDSDVILLGDGTLEIGIDVEEVTTACRATVAFEDEHFDLDSGRVSSLPFPFPGLPPDPDADFHIAYNAGGSVHSRVFQDNGAQIAHLRAIGYGEVNAAHIASAAFTTSLIDEPFGSDRVILIRTAAGAVFKLGNPSETTSGLSFDFQALTGSGPSCGITPPSAPTATLRFEDDYFDLDAGTVITTDPTRPFPEAGADFNIAYNAGGTVHSRVFQDGEIAHLIGRSFASVTASDASSAAFTRSLIDEPFDSGRVVLIRTTTGAVFKLGNPIETTSGLTFSYARL